MLIEEDPSGVDTDDYFLAAWRNAAGSSISRVYLGLESEVCKCNERSPCPVRVSLYARMGLHRYKLTDLLSGVVLQEFKVEESEEVQYNDDWIRLYICGTCCCHKNYNH